MIMVTELSPISSEGNANTDPHTIEIRQQAEGEVGNTVIDYQFNPASGDINDITVNGQTASSAAQDYVLGIVGDVAEQCVMTISDNPANNGTNTLDGLSNDGAGAVSADNPVTFTFTDGALASDAASDNVADRFSVVNANSCLIHIADLIETLQN